MPEETTPADSKAAKLTPICAIGASAGGVGALQALFRLLPTNLGLAYVVILHLSPDQPSALSEVLSACTRMSVNQVKDSRISADWSEMRELFGGGLLNPTEAPSQSWLEHYMPEDDRERVREVIEEAIAARSMLEIEHRVVCADGSIGWTTHSRAIPILDPEGEIVEWFGSAGDVTLQHRAQGALRESEERLRVLVEGVPQHVWRADGSGRWTWSSPQWRRYTSLSEAESGGFGWLAAVHPRRPRRGDDGVARERGRRRL